MVTASIFVKLSSQATSLPSNHMTKMEACRAVGSSLMLTVNVRIGDGLGAGVGVDVLDVVEPQGMIQRASSRRPLWHSPCLAQHMPHGSKAPVVANNLILPMLTNDSAETTRRKQEPKLHRMAAGSQYSSTPVPIILSSIKPT